MEGDEVRAAALAVAAQVLAGRPVRPGRLVEWAVALAEWIREGSQSGIDALEASEIEIPGPGALPDVRPFDRSKALEHGRVRRESREALKLGAAAALSNGEAEG